MPYPAQIACLIWLLFQICFLVLSSSKLFLSMFQWHGVPTKSSPCHFFKILRSALYRRLSKMSLFFFFLDMSSFQLIALRSLSSQPLAAAYSSSCDLDRLTASEPDKPRPKSYSMTPSSSERMCLSDQASDVPTFQALIVQKSSFRHSVLTQSWRVEMQMPGKAGSFLNFKNSSSMPNVSLFPMDMYLLHMLSMYLSPITLHPHSL